MFLKFTYYHWLGGRYEQGGLFGLRGHLAAFKERKHALGENLAGTVLLRSISNIETVLISEHLEMTGFHPAMLRFLESLDFDSEHLEMTGFYQTIMRVPG